VTGLISDAAGPQLDVGVREREPEPVLLDPQEHGIVDDSPVGQTEEDVLALLDLAFVEVAGDEQVGEVEGVWP
jgi:hypothetical protein